MEKKKAAVVSTPEKTTKQGGIDWKALGYDSSASTDYEAADDIKVDVGPSKFKVVAGRTYRIGFPFVKPVMDAKGRPTDAMQVLLKPVEHLRFYDDDSKSGAKFVMPKNDDKLRKRIIDTFTSKNINTHYLTPVIVYDTNEEGKLLSPTAVSYSMKILSVPAGRYAKLKEASEQFGLADYDFLVTLDGDEKTESFQKMNFKAQTKKGSLDTKTAIWQKNKLVKLPDDEDAEPTPVSMSDIIAEAYAMAPDMLEVLGTRELKNSKIKEILEEWEGVESEEEDEEENGIDDDYEEEEDDVESEEESEGEDAEDDDVEDSEEDIEPEEEDE